MIAALNMAAKILCSAIEQVIYNLVLLWKKRICLLIFIDMLTKNIGNLDRRLF